jgi:hypothetical protein
MLQVGLLLYLVRQPVLQFADLDRSLQLDSHEPIIILNASEAQILEKPIESILSQERQLLWEDQWTNQSEAIFSRPPVVIYYNVFIPDQEVDGGNAT